MYDNIILFLHCDMSKFKGRRILITGASSGIGKALAIKFAQLEAYVIAIGKRELAPEEFENLSLIRYHSIDLSEPQSHKRVTDLLLDSIDVFVSNAGMAYSKPFIELSESEINEQLQINLTTIIYLTRELIINKKLTEGGKIIYLSSLSGIYPMAEMSLYCSAKFGLEGFVNSIKQELGDRFRFTLVYPGITMTNFFKRANMEKFTDYLKEHPYASHTADRVAQEIIENFDKNTIIVGSDKIYLKFEKFIPQRFKSKFLTWTSIFNRFV